MQYPNFLENLEQYKTELKHFADYIKAYKEDYKEESRKANEGNWEEVKTNRENYLKKTDWKPDKSRYKGYLELCRKKYRHMHIAYSLLRGRTMKQIEPKVREGNEPDISLIDQYVEEFMNIKDFFVNLMNFRRQKPVIKMYVLVRKDIEPENRMVQGGHAVAQYLLEHGSKEKSSNNGKVTDTWKNGYMIYLGIENESELNLWEAKLQAAEKKFSTFVEPDWGEPTKTAIACIDFGEIFKDLELLTLDPLEVEGSDVLVTDETIEK